LMIRRSCRTWPTGSIVIEKGLGMDQKLAVRTAASTDHPLEQRALQAHRDVWIRWVILILPFVSHGTLVLY
jgi:hypothetical protein